MTAACSEEDCRRPVRGRGLCGTHYAFRSRHGTLPPLNRVPLRVAGCKADGCASTLKGGLGYCSQHYQRLKYRGSLEQPAATAPDEERFWAKVDTSAGPDGCWPWTAKRESTGYGRVWWNGTNESAHRVAYTISHGRIPDSLTIDHMCRNRACQNPRHLRAVTHAVNNRASSSPAAINAAKTHCIRGHEFTPENTYARRDGRTSRECRACRAFRDGQQRSRPSSRATA